MSAYPQATPTQAARLRQLFEESHYSEDGIARLLGEVEVPSIAAGTLPRLLYRTREGGRLAVLCRLFLFGVEVNDQEAASALEPFTLAELAEMGLLESGDGQARALVTIVPADGIMVTTELASVLERNARPDGIMGITTSTRLLGEATLRKPLGRMLDLGCGSGYQALRGAAHSKEVIATDLNARAGHFTKFNAAFNGLSNIDVRIADGFAPVAGLTFDAIVSNLPFVISPSRQYFYRDAGMPADDFVRMILRETPAYLNPGGYAYFMLGWAHRQGQSGEDRLAEWLKDSGCDVWVVTTFAQDVTVYAESWIRDTESREPEKMRRLFDEWMDYYRREQIERIDTGLLIMHKVSGRPNWFRAQHAPDLSPVASGVSDWIANRFERYTLIASIASDEEWMQRVWKPAARLNVLQVSRPGTSGWALETPEVALQGPVLTRGNIDRTGLRMLMYFDGVKTANQVADRMAVEFRADPEQVRTACLDMLKRWVEAGFLESAAT